MKSNLEKFNPLKDYKISRMTQTIILLPVIVLFLCAVNMVFIRPMFMSNMMTVAVDLISAGALLILLCISIILLIVKALAFLVRTLRTRAKATANPWLPKLRNQTIMTISIAVTLTIVIISTQLLAYTPPILGADNKPLAGSVAVLAKIDLNGSKQWITIRGKSVEKPVILFLAGGPGGTQLAATRTHLKKLEEHFVVVNWEQPGAGKSYHAIPHGEITPKRYIEDAYVLTKYLCKEFHQDKIYIVGESWGAALGIMLVQQYPELYHAFMGTGQMVDFTETEIMDYKLALKIATEKKDTAMIEKLTQQGLPPYYGKGYHWKIFNYVMYLGQQMSSNPSIVGGYTTLQDMAGPEYGLYDKVTYALGPVNTFAQVYHQLYEIDLRKEAPKLDVPIYFLLGRHDINAPTALAEEYFRQLEAPHKEMIWFEHSGHSPWVNENDKFADTIIQIASKTSE